MRSEHVVARAVGSATLASHFGASHEDHGPNVVLYRAGPQTARRAGSLRGHDHSRQSSSRPKSLRRPRSFALPLRCKQCTQSGPLTEALCALDQNPGFSPCEPAHHPRPVGSRLLLATRSVA
jgi:hypothetical protein